LKVTACLIENLNRYYELQLCYAELVSLEASNISFDLLKEKFTFECATDVLRKIWYRTSWLQDINGEKTLLAQIIEANQKVIWKYADLWFPHLCYPFKARMRPQIARSLVNLVAPEEESWVLDPFCGSGTTNVEAYLCGVNSVGMDIIPFYSYMSEAKISFFEEKINWNPLLSVDANHKILKVIYSATNLLKTKTNFEKRVSEIVKLQQIFQTFKSQIKPSKHVFKVGTATELPYPENYFGGIVTSPPYGSAIKYEKENPGPKELMDIPRSLKAFQILTKDETHYKQLMKLCFKEMWRVLKRNGRLAIILGNQKRKGKIIDYISWGKGELTNLGFELLYDFTELLSSIGTRNILYDRILVFQKK